MTITWTEQKRKLSELTPWQRNPRQIKGDQAKRLLESVETFGQVETLAIGPGNEVYNGHQRLNVLRAAYGANHEVDVRVASRELSEKEREKLTVYLHKGAAGEWNFDILANEFEIDELLEWGFEPFELGLDELDDKPVGEDTGADVSKADELQAVWQVQPGDLWQLGEHRLVCGDCTDAAVVERAMGGEKCALVVTDPPYGVEYADKNKFLNAIARGNRIQEHIEGDHDTKEETQAMWKAAFQQMNEVMNPGAVVYCFMPQGGDQMMMMMMMMMMGAGIEPRHELIWLKNNHVLGRVDYAYKHEPILYAWKAGGHKFYGDFQTSILEFPKPQKSDLHPTTKPVELVARLIENSSQSNEIVYEPFSGSGTTLIACEQLSRRCRAIEISPAYCAVALQRWADMTGKTPERVE